MTLDANGVSTVSGTPTSVTKTYGTNVSLPSITSDVNGFIFDGWYKESACTNQYTGNTELSTTNGAIVSIYAKWKVKITYNANGHGVAPAETQVDKGSNYTLGLINATSVAGYINDGKWYDTSTCTTSVGDMNTAITVNAPLNLYAKWAPIKYTLVYNPNISGQTGTVTPNQVSTQSNIEYEQNVTLNNSYSSTSHTFGGWSLAPGPNNVKNYNEGETVNKLSETDGAIVVLYAHWVPGAYKVKFNGNGATSGTMSEQNITVGEGAHLTPNAYEKTGYTFAGWSTTSGGAVEYTNCALYTNPTAVKEQTYDLFVVWQEKEYSIIYNTNGGIWNSPLTDADTKRTYTASKTLKTGTDITKEGHTFAGWYDNQSLSGSQVTSVPANTSSDKTFYAKWSINSYQVTFDTDGGPTIPSQTIQYNQRVTKPSDPTKDHAVFNYWYKVTGAAGEENTAYNFSTPITSETTLKAKWTPAFDVTFNLNGGYGSINPQYIISGQKATKPIDPTKDSNKFKHWYKDGESADVSFDFNTAITSDTTLKAAWEPGQTTYLITLDKNGHGEILPSYLDKQYVVSGEKAVAPQTPVETGYTFVRWYDASLSDDTSFDFNTAITGAKTLKAKWQENTYIITYITNGGTWTAAPTDTDIKRTYTQSKTLKTDITRTDYTFAGWYDNASFIGNAITTIAANTAANKIFYAKWNISSDTHTVTFDANGGSTIANQTIVHNQKATKPIDPTKDHAVFNYWYKVTGAAGEENTAYNFNTPITSDITLKAKWTENAKVVSFNLDGGYGSIPSQNIISGQKATKPGNPTKAGHKFLYWYNEAVVAATEFNFTNTPITSDITLKAKWESGHTTHAVTLDKNGHGSIPSIYEIQYIVEGQKAVAPPAPSETGYAFVRWYDASLSDSTAFNFNTAINADKTLKAKWQENTYTITYNVNSGTWTTALTDADKKRLYTESKTLKTDIKRNGFVFAGWYETNNFSDVPITEVYAYTADNKVFYAKWLPVTYFIEFNLNGVSADQILPIQKTYGTNLSLPTPTNAPNGYIFQGWYKESACTNKYTGSGDLSSEQGTSITLYAKWKLTTYTIKYNATGGQVTPTLFTKSYGIDYTSLATPTKNAYIFGGWYKESACTNAYDGTSDLTNTDGAVVEIFAKWTIDTIPSTINPSAATISEIVFNANGGSGTMYPVAIYDTDTDVALPANTFTKSGYSFSKWSINQNGSGTTYSNSQHVNGAIVASLPHEEISATLYRITLYAQWTQNSNGGTGGTGSSGGSGGGGGGGGKAGAKPNQNATGPFGANYDPNYEYEGPSTNPNVKEYTNVTYKTNDDGSTSALDENGKLIEGFCKIKDDKGVDHYYFFTEEGRLYCGFMLDVKGTLYHFDNLSGQLDGESRWTDELSKTFVGMPILMALKDTWIYDPVTGTWKFFKVTADGKIGDACINGIYSIGNGDQKKVFYFDESGTLVVGGFIFNNLVMLTSLEEADKGAILGILDATGTPVFMDIEPTAQLKKSALVVN